MTRSAPETLALEHAADRAPRHSVKRLVRRIHCDYWTSKFCDAATRRQKTPRQADRLRPKHRLQGARETHSPWPTTTEASASTACESRCEMSQKSSQELKAEQLRRTFRIGSPTPRQ